MHKYNSIMYLIVPICYIMGIPNNYMDYINLIVIIYSTILLLLITSSSLLSSYAIENYGFRNIISENEIKKLYEDMNSLEHYKKFIINNIILIICGLISGLIYGNFFIYLIFISISFQLIFSRKYMNTYLLLNKKEI